MKHQVPLPLQRVHTRLVHRDAAAMIAERLTDEALIAATRWLRSCAWGDVDGLRGRAPMLMQILDETAAEVRKDPIWHESTILFGAGLVVGCQLRDAVESDTAGTCLVGFDAAARQLDSTDVLTALWNCGLPEDELPLGETMTGLLKLAPRLATRLRLAQEIARGLPHRTRRPLFHLHFVAGLIGAGVGAPVLRGGND